jgi:uncharacterized protein (DUF1697 family)
MPAYVALLRGINVGGKRSLPMAKVREAFEGAGARSVETYIQSGNVVFTHAQRSSAKLCTELATALVEPAGFAVPVVLRSATEWSGAIAATPYLDPEILHCAFLPEPPTAAQLAKIDKIDRSAFLPSRFTVHGRHVYLELPDGIGRAKLAGAVLRVFPEATVRNWRTVQRLAELLAKLA